ncbi:MAG TPA: aminotransferase DegT [Rhodospirillaceae bacterium]|nr:aminotransferase DegT [Rhodospirillaceae bacterium]
MEDPLSVAFIDLKTQYQTLKASIDQRIHTVLDHGQYIMGPEVKELEGQLQTYTGAQHCITVSSGTDALLIALMALGVEAGDEVITTPFTFIATAEVIVRLGAAPVFVDVEPDTCNIDASKIEAAITKKTKAIMPVSLYGQVADMDAINEIANRHNLAVIEDAAQSFGADYKGKKSCNLSTIGCTSFFPSKPLGCYGDGGAIFTSDDTLAKVMREIRLHGAERRYYHTRVGIGGRMDTLQCAVVLAKMERFAWEVEQRIAIGQRYGERLAKGEGVTLTAVRPDRNSVWAQYTIQVNEREALAARLKERGVPTAVHYPVPLHQQPVFKTGIRVVGSLTNAETVAKRVMSLPMHPYMDNETMDRIVDAVLAG